MITKTNTGYKIQSNIEGEKISLSFDEKSLDHLMNIMIDLYSDPEMAVIREYSTNALDAHVAVGNTDPIQVFLPTDFNPTLRIQDYGIGLSLEDINNIYSKYGASTKRETNDQVGMLGLGCKSALTYNSQFTLSSVKDGMKIVVSVSRNERNAGEILIIEHFETDEPSGTLITVPTKPYSSFADKALFFFSFWEKGTVLVNGKEPPTYTVSSQLDDNIVVIDTSGWRVPSYFHSDIIVMGNVPYPVKFDARDTLFKRHGRYGYVDENLRFLVRVEIGEVEFTPSRESLAQNKRTETLVSKYNEKIMLLFHDSLQKEIESQKTAFGAMKKAAEFIDRYGSKTLPKFEYDGEEIPTKLTQEDIGYKPEKEETVITIGLDYYDSWQAFYGWHPGNLVRWSEISKLVFVKNYTVKYNSAHKAKLKMALENESSYFRTLICGESVPSSKWLPENLIILDWEEVRKLKPETKSGTYKKISGSFRGYVNDTFNKEIAADKLGKNLYYIHTRHWYDLAAFIKGNLLPLKDKNEPLYVVEVAENRKAKFLRDFPHAEPVLEAAKKENKRMLDVLTADEDLAIMVIGKFRDAESILKILDKSRVDDPELKRISSFDFSAARETYNKLEYCRTAARSGEWKLKTTPTNPLAAYPLLSYWGLINSPEDTYIYLNAAYAARK